MYFASDNWAGASEPVMKALSEHADGYEPAYGAGPICDGIEAQFQEIFETDCTVFVVATGTAANALALSALTGPAGAVFCHKEAHIRVDECGAPEFLTSGARMWGLEGKFGKLPADAVQTGLEEVPPGIVHHGQPSALSITQATESGTLYTVEEIAHLARQAHDNQLAVHMDGARFANALVSLGVSPAEMSWKAGIDVLSFGATKNGAWCAEAVVFFNKDYAKDFIYRRKRAGHLFSKMRFVAAQFEGYFTNDHWLENARHSNAMAARLVNGIRESKMARLAWDCPSNEVFAILPKTAAAKATQAGAQFYEWPPQALDRDERPNNEECLIRLVCSYRTTQAEVDQFLDLIHAP